MNDMIERRAYLAMLFDIYGGMLTEKQQNMFDLYHQCDLSLGEIAEESLISRQAVFDVIKRTEHALEEYEAKLHLVEKEIKRRKIIDELKSRLGELTVQEGDALAMIKDLLDALEMD